jgi:hypothetical protein
LNGRSVVGWIAPRPELDDALSVISSPTAILAADVAGYSHLIEAAAHLGRSA